MSYFRHPRQVRARRWFFLFHLWAGLLVGFFLTVVGLTGSILVFNQEIRKRFSVQVAPSSARDALDIPALAKVTRAHFPNAHITYVSLPGTPAEPAQVSTEDPQTRRAGGLSIHPRTGAVLAETVTHEGFIDWSYRVHIYLLAGDSGYFFNGLFAALAVVLCISGAVIWWPGPKLWKRALAVNTKARWKRVNYDLHRSFGFFSALALALVFLTGVYFRFPKPFVAVVQKVTGTKVHDVFLETPVRNLAVISPEQALAQGSRALGGGRTTALGFARPDLPFFRVERQLPDGTSRTVAVDAYSGRVLDISNARPPSLAERILSWAGPVHFGTWGGRLTQVIWVVLGLMPGLLFITGVLMYWNRILSKRLRRQTAHRNHPPVFHTASTNS